MQSLKPNYSPALHHQTIVCLRISALWVVLAAHAISLPSPAIAAPPFFSRVKPDPDKEKSSGTLVVGKEGYRARSKEEKKKSLKKSGGNAFSEKAVEEALNWLARHQNRDGSWSFMHTAGDNCSNFDDPGSAETRTGATGLALLPFLGAGYTHREDSIYQKTVSDGLQYLKDHVQITGALYDTMNHETMYTHGIAACAIAEAYGMTFDQDLKVTAQQVIDFITTSQDKRQGGWRYTPGKDSDTSVVGWQVMALKSGKISELKVPEATLAGVSRWLDSVQAGKIDEYRTIGSSYSYTGGMFPQNPSGDASATTAIGLLCRNYLGVKRSDGGLRDGVNLLAQKGPDPGNMYYNYYATMVLFNNSGPSGKLWKAWNTQMRDYLIETQVKAGKDKGSWHFDGPWVDRGGRLYDTALSAMTLEVYYRYLPIYGVK